MVQPTPTEDALLQIMGWLRSEDNDVGRPPPIDPFTGEDPEIRFEDWLPALVRASCWNDWSPEENLLQLAGHLRGRALQEWGSPARQREE